MGYSYGPGYAAPGHSDDSGPASPADSGSASTGSASTGSASTGPAYAGAGRPAVPPGSGGYGASGGYPAPGGPGEWRYPVGPPQSHAVPAVEHAAPAAGHGGPPAPDTGPSPEGGGPAAYQPVPPVVAATPALKGYPGGPGLDENAEDEAGPGGREARVLSSPSVWQNAQRAWRDSGVEWQRSVADYEPAEAEFDRIQSAPHGKRRTATRAASSGQLSARSAGALSATLARQSASGTGQAGRPSGGGFHISRGVWLTALIIIVVAALVAGGLALFGKKSTPKQASGSQYPSATPAAADFTTSAGQAGRGIFQGVTGVAAAGGTVVAIGAQTGQWLPRAQFLVSTDGGQSWRLAAQRSVTGAQPTPGFQPQLVTHGAHGWLAVGLGAAWTSPDGRTWTLASGSGIGPLHRGDAVAALAGTGNGFLAVGDNVPNGKPGLRNPVLWTSQNGQSWKRLSGSQVKLDASGGRVLRLDFIAASGSNVVVAGTAYAPHGKGKHRKFSVINSVWRSGNNGASWSLAHLPVGKGVSGAVTGLATAGTGFVAIRPGSSKATSRDVATYTSGTGASWAKGGTITADKSAKLSISMLAGSDQGVVAAGQVSGGGLVAYESSNGHSWHGVSGVGSAKQILTGVAVTTGGAVVAGGASNPTSLAQAPYLVLTAAGKRPRTVSFAHVAGATGPSLRIDGIAVAGGKQLAVGSANGRPAIWSAPAGTARHWSPASSSALNRPGLSVLSGVAHGRDGWVAVGGTTAASAVHPIVVGSANGTDWQTDDSESAFAGAGITLHAVAAGPSGYVAAGQQAVPAKTTTTTTGHGKNKKTVKHVTPAHTISAAWYSAGLTGWNRATVPKDSGPGVWQIAAVATGKSGFVAVGSAGKYPAAWTSSNGQHWQLVQLGPPAGASTATLQEVAVRGSVIVATGMASTSAGNNPFADYSTDGGSIWQQEQLTAPGGPATVTALTATARGFAATGSAGQPGNQRVVVWWSTGGFSWKPIEPSGTGMNGPGVQQITALTASGSTLTGAGYLATTSSQQPTLWHATAGP